LAVEGKTITSEKGAEQRLSHFAELGKERGVVLGIENLKHNNGSIFKRGSRTPDSMERPREGALGRNIVLGKWLEKERGQRA